MRVTCRENGNQKGRSLIAEKNSVAECQIIISDSTRQRIIDLLGGVTIELNLLKGL